MEDKPRNIDAVIFDMDGVLIDSEPLQFASIRDFLDGFGHIYTEADHQRFVGTSTRRIFEHYKRIDSTLTQSVQTLLLARRALFMQRIDRPLTPMAGVKDLIEEIASRGLPMAVASASSEETVERTLTNLGIRKVFEFVMCGDMVEHPKPAPEIYLRTAKRLGVSPHACLVFEDSGPGVLSATAAGCLVVAVPCASSRSHDLSAAQLHTDSLANVDLAQILD